MTHRKRNRITEYWMTTSEYDSKQHKGYLIRTVYRVNRSPNSNRSRWMFYGWQTHDWQLCSSAANDGLEPTTIEAVREMYQPAYDWPNLG